MRKFFSLFANGNFDYLIIPEFGCYVTIPSNAAYVKFNMAKNSGWTAVLSAESLLK